MIIESDYEKQALRKAKLHTLVNKVQKPTLPLKKYIIQSTITHTPSRVYSYSRSIRHFQEILAKIGDTSIDKRAAKLLISKRNAKSPISIDHMTASYHNQQVQTEDQQFYIIDSTSPPKTDRESVKVKHKEAFWVKQRKFTNMSIQKPQPKSNNFMLMSRTERNPRQEFQFNNPLIQQSISRSPKAKQKYTTMNKTKIKYEPVFSTMPLKFK